MLIQFNFSNFSNFECFDYFHYFDFWLLRFSIFFDFFFECCIFPFLNFSAFRVLQFCLARKIEIFYLVFFVHFDFKNKIRKKCFQLFSISRNFFFWVKSVIILVCLGLVFQRFQSDHTLFYVVNLVFTKSAVRFKYVIGKRKKRSNRWPA